MQKFKIAAVQSTCAFIIGKAYVYLKNKGILFMPFKKIMIPDNKLILKPRISEFKKVRVICSNIAFHQHV